MSNDGQTIVDAFTILVEKGFKAKKMPGQAGVIQVVTPFLTNTSQPLTFFAYRGEDNHLYLTDCRHTIDSLNHIPIVGGGVGVNKKLLQDLIRTYGLILTEGGAIVESSKLPLGKRVMSLVAGRIAVDGLLRLWDQRPKETEP